jgi:hypothetical protein
MIRGLSSLFLPRVDPFGHDQSRTIRVVGLNIRAGADSTSLEFCGQSQWRLVRGAIDGVAVYIIDDIIGR